MIRYAHFLITGLLLAVMPRTNAAVEPWTDPKLAIRDGLVLWLDASKQNQARETKSLRPLVSGALVNALYDGSGHGRHLVQRERDAQPRYQAAGDVAVVRFDGRDDHLELLGPGRSLDAYTMFLVVAPRSNPGGFSAFVAGHAVGGRDYDVGFNLDQGPWPSTRFESLNLEGGGFSGAVDLLNESLPFHTAHTLEIQARAGQGGIKLVVDGRPQGQRDRKAGSLPIEDLTLGARFYTNDDKPAFTQGFLDGDIAEVLLFDRILDDAASRQVRSYLAAKYDGLNDALAESRKDQGEILLETVANPPPVQMLVPGFTVRELPIKLTNINNLRYRHDGKLVALAYNGNVYLLSDRDGDGLEETASLFWDNQGRLRSPIGMALTPPGDRHGVGLYVASKGKCSVIVDTDGDDVADREVVVATGWKEIPHAVDALGVAVADDGSVYFGIGSENFGNAYLLDKQGKAHYDVAGDRGTIQRILPDFQSRETVATGIRFPVALAFNRRGDLFATDQEGATWLPNGNPFDELLEIRKGRHYGFPPRHPNHLQGVIDEPSVFDYAPQHQSTCGLTFNEPVGKEAGATFGPSSWTGDALVCGYSRGKLYRTRLVKSSAGYVAKTDLVACLSRLTADACLALDGSLAVATHSGGPDWGSGPSGQGTLYKIEYDDRDHPQPVLAWPESSREVRVAFDRPLNPDHLQDLASTTTITSGQAVAAGDRFETLRPGYATVAAQLTAPRRPLAVQGVSLTPDRRTLLLATAPQTVAGPAAITLPGLGRPQAEDRTGAEGGERPQVPAIDLAYDLSGVHAAWRSHDGAAPWTGWLPHLDLAVARSFTAQSAGHDLFWPRLDRPGTLTLRAQLNLRNVLRPAVQPGSKLDAELPAEQVTVKFESTAPIEVKAPAGTTAQDSNSHTAAFTFNPTERGLIPIEVTLRTGEGSKPRLSVSYSTAEDARARPIPLSRVLVPWAQTGSSKPAEATARVVPDEWKGGSRARGRDLFFGEVARCAQCHTVRGEGGHIGPDLSNLVERDYASVLRDLREPSFAINPDFISYNLALRDGRVLTGPLRTEGQSLRVGDPQGHETVVPRAEVEEAQPVSTSIMPEGLPALLGPDRMKDLLAFLMEPGLEPAPIRREGAPPARTKAEVENVLKASASTSTPPSTRPAKPLRIVLVDGPKDHGVDEHDYPVWKKRWEALLAQAQGVTVSTATTWPSADDFAKADVLVWYSANPGWSAAKGPELDAFLARGGGMVYLHFAVEGRSAPEELARRIGLAWRDGRSKFRHGPLALDFAAGHPLASGFSKLKLEDESYWDLVGDPSKVQVLATGVEEGQARPLMWTYQQGPGRVFCSIPGHYSWTFDDPLFRLLILRGIAWSAGEPLHRLDPLATVGAKLAP